MSACKTLRCWTVVRSVCMKVPTRPKLLNVNRIRNMQGLFLAVVKRRQRTLVRNGVSVQTLRIPVMLFGMSLMTRLTVVRLSAVNGNNLGATCG